MLRVQRLDCDKPKFHKECEWVNVPITYPDTLYLQLKKRLIYEVKKTHTAYRITHWKFGVLTTLKWGHDEELYIGDVLEALKAFALF